MAQQHWLGFRNRSADSKTIECVCTIHIKAGAAGLTLGKGWGLSLGAGECWGTRGLAGWLAEVGAGAGPGWPIENALKAATFQKQKKKQKKNRKKTQNKHKKKQKLAQEKKENDFVFFVFFFCAMNCVFFVLFFVV